MNRRRDVGVAAIACALVAVVAAVDLVLTDRIIITPLVTAAPLLAALLRATPRTTAIVGAAALAVVIASGAWNHYFGSADHVVRVVNCLVAGSLAVLIAVMRRRIDRARRRSASLYGELETVVHQMPAGIALRDPAGRLLLANAQAEEILGGPLPDLDLTHGPAPYSVYHQDGSPYELRTWPNLRALRGETVHEEEVEVERPDGTRRALLVSAAPVHAPDGSLASSVLIMNDITDRVRDRRALELVVEAGRRLDEAVDVDRRLETLATFLAPRLGDICVIHLCGEDGRISRTEAFCADPALQGLVREIERRFPLDLDGDHPSARAIRSGDPEPFDRDHEAELAAAVKDGPEHRRLMDEIAQRGGIGIALRARGEVLGAILLSSRADRTYDAADRDLLRVLARRAALSIDNAKLYERQHHVAATLQREMLPPSPPAWPGLDVATLYRPASSTADVGGDFFDLFDRETGHIAVIGDVSGKGVDAAAVTALTRHAIRVATRTTHGLPALLEAVNDTIREDATGDQFCTLVLAALHRDRGRLRADVVCAGHPPPFLVRADGRVEVAGHGGTLLGFFPAPAFRVASARLDAGDALVLFTDGLTEARTGTGFFGEGPLERLLSTCGGLPAAGTIQRVQEELDRSCDRLRDDLAMVVISVTG